jgi:putative transposase
VTVVKAPTGKYFVSFVVAVDDNSQELAPVEAETGIDLGLKDFAVLRGGKVIESQKFFRKMERRLAKAQRALSRRQKGSANREKARLKVAKLHEQTRNRRDDWLNKQVATIIGENQAVYVEDLNVQGLTRGRAAKSMHDQALGMFLSRLRSKARRSGRTFARVDRFFPSTQLCSTCGALTGPKGREGLSIREWACPCGAAHDRDVNAEINIRREGQRLVAAGHAETRNACGQGVRPGAPGGPGQSRKGQKQEPSRARLVPTSCQPGILSA